MAATVRPIRRKELTWWDNTYLPSVALGVCITMGHFFRNLVSLTLYGLRIRKGRGGVVTYQYPEEQRPLAKRTRTRHRLTQREDGSPRCVACMMCETVCPARCIDIVAGEHPDPAIEKYPVAFNLDLGMCVYCGFCVEVCPEDAIRMDTEILDTAAYSRREMQLDIRELLNPRSGGLYRRSNQRP